jgi:hypothetical protein
MDKILDDFEKIKITLDKVNATSQTINPDDPKQIYDLMVPFALSGYSYCDELKQYMYYDINHVLNTAKRFNKIIDYLNKQLLNQEQIINKLNSNSFSSDEIGQKNKQIHQLLLEHIIEKNMLEKANEPIDELFNDSTDESTDETINESTDETINELTESNNDSSDKIDYDLSDEELEQDFVNDYLRPNQLIAINNTIKQNWSSGIHCQIMGAGKSIIMLNLIQTHFNMFKENKIYIICTERIEILKQMFLKNIINTNKYELNKDNIKLWKHNSIIDISQFTFIENLTNQNKKFISVKPLDKPVLWVINNSFLKINKNYEKINRSKIAIILCDECHFVSGKHNYNMLKYFKYGKLNDTLIIPIFGFSATPLRDSKNASKQLIDIFSSNLNKQQLNIISNYNLIDAIKDKIVLPFKHIIIETKYNDLTEINKNQFDETIKYVFNDLIINNNELPYKKGVSWSRKISNIDYYYNIISKILKKPTFNIYKHHSKINNTTEFENFCNSNNNSLLLCVNCCKEGSDIKNLDYALYLDNVKNRSTLVSLQSSGRIMRPDEYKLKKYAYIYEIVEIENKQIEYLSVEKLINYYKSILNLAQSNDDNDYNKEILNDFIKLFNNTKINEETSEFLINIDSSSNACTLKLLLKSIDWGKLRECFNTEHNKFKLKLSKLTNHSTKKETQYYMVYISPKSIFNFNKNIKDSNCPVWGFKQGKINDLQIKKIICNNICFYTLNDEFYVFKVKKYIFSTDLSSNLWNSNDFPHTIYLSQIIKIKINLDDIRLSQNWDKNFYPRGIIIIDINKIIKVYNEKNKLKLRISNFELTQLKSEQDEKQSHNPLTDTKTNVDILNQVDDTLNDIEEELNIGKVSKAKKTSTKTSAKSSATPVSKTLNKPITKSTKQIDTDEEDEIQELAKTIVKPVVKSLVKPIIKQVVKSTNKPTAKSNTQH